ncbi:hypothetical protein O3P69_003118 [Scylla paramamosain]|uniref:G-patch domain-containing protein n=4 Tax=Scylla TaxID=6760 RepID=A0AAW0UL31_SCYPA
MSNKYPVQVRMREMSKQEEILMKKKREIERKMKEQQHHPQAGGRKAGGGGGGSGGGGSGGVAVPRHPPHHEPASTSEIELSPAMNKFNNDGSFLEQFKKLKNKTEVKEEKYSTSHKSKSSGQGTNKLKAYCQSVPKQTDAAHTYPRQDNVSPPYPDEVKPHLHVDERVDSLPFSEDVKNETENPDWFQDALKRAQAKAKELSETPTVSLSACSSEEDSSNSKFSDMSQSRKRKSRWGGQPAPAAAPVAPLVPASTTSFSVPENLMDMVGEGEHFQAIHGVMVTRLTRNNPAIVAYAQKVFGSLDLTDAQWKQCEEQMKMNVVFQLLQAKKRESERLEKQGKVKYEYDSDEDVDGGTWEHKRRAKEMEETQARAAELTTMAEGKHHIGDFLPPDELARFMEKYRAIKEGRDPDLSDYQDHKLTEDNVGYRMLKSMGWTEGMGLGAEGKGITTPVNQNGRSENQGLGVERPETLQEEDDEYDAYRKRMMLAYRFRPNPLNNPRRAYY